MKYDEHHINKITTALANGDGRWRACKIADVDYSTFLEWIKKKPEFAQAVRDAEDKGNDKIKDLAKRGIIEKFQTQWQAAAWWLERNYPDEFRNRLENEVNIKEHREILKRMFEDEKPKP